MRGIAQKGIRRAGRRLTALGALVVGVAALAILPDASAHAQTDEPAAAWQGPYAGAEAGGRFSKGQWTTKALTFSPLVPVDGSTAKRDINQTRPRLGVFAGYNLAVTGNLLLGLEGDVGFAFGGARATGGIPGTSATTFDSGDKVSLDSFFDAAVRARVGYAFSSDLLVYAAPGVAWQRSKYAVSCPGSAASLTSWCASAESGTTSDTHFGWTLGGGIEARAFDQWIVRADYRYADFGTKDMEYFQDSTFMGLIPGVDRISAKSQLRTHTLSIGFARQF